MTETPALPSSSRPPVVPAVSQGLPPIRTIADDLAAAARGELVDGELTGRRVSVGPSRPPTSGVQPVSFPSNLRAARRRGRLVRRALIAGVGLMVLGGVGWMVSRVLPRTTGTVADLLPSETLAFVTVRLARNTDQPALLLRDLRDRLVHAVGPLPEDVLAGALEITVLLLPGASAGEPVPALFVRGLPHLDLSAAPTLGVKAYADGNLVVKSEHLGRLQALSETRWSQDQNLRRLFRGLPRDAPILVGLRSEVVAGLLRSLSPHAGGDAPSLLLALAPDAAERTAAIHGRTTAPWKVTSELLTAEVLSRLPASTTLAFQSAALLTVLTEGNRLLPDAVSAFARAVQADDGAREFLKQGLVAPGVVGVLPTETAGVRDTIAVFGLHAGVDATDALRRLESALLLLGPAITGTEVEGASFAEADADGVLVRYANFGDTGRAIDYAVIDDLLLVATSKASMRALLESVRGNASLGSDAGVAVLARSEIGGGWIFLRSDPQVRSELPAATAVFLDLFRLLLLRPTQDGVLAGTAILPAPRLLVPPPFPTPTPADTEPTEVSEPASSPEPVVTEELAEPTGEDSVGSAVE